MVDIAMLGIGVDSREVDRGRRSLSRFRQTATRTERATKKLSETTSRMSRAYAVARRAFFAVAAAAAITGAALLGTTRDAAALQVGMNQVLAVSGASEAQFASLRAEALKLGSSTRFTATQVSEAMGFMAQAGLRTDDILGGIGPTLSLAAAANIDLAQSADIVTNVMTGFGQEADQLQQSVDVLTATFTSSNTNLEQLGEAFKLVGPVAAGAGQGFEETAAALGLLGNAGLQGSIAGTTLRQTFAALLDQTPEVTRTLDALGISVTDSTGNLRPLVDIIRQLEQSGAGVTEIMQIFGVRAGPGMLALVRQGSGALEELTAQLENAGGTADEIAKIQLRGLTGAMTQMKSAAEGLSIAIDDKVGVTAFLERLALAATRAFQSLTSSVRSSIDPAKLSYEQLADRAEKVTEEIKKLDEQIAELQETNKTGDGFFFTTSNEEIVLRRLELERQIELIRELQALQALASEGAGVRVVPRPDQGTASPDGEPGGGGASLERITQAKEFIKQLEFEQAQLGRSAREQEIYNNLQAAGVTRTSEFGQQIALLTGQMHDYASAQRSANEQARLFESVFLETRTPIEAMRLEIDKLRDIQSLGEEGARTFERAQTMAAARAANQYGQMASDVGQALGVMFEDSKAVAIAQALINTYQGITAAIAEYPPPLSFAMAAAQAAMGFAQVSAIRSQSRGSGGGGRTPTAGPTPTPPTPTAPAAPTGGADRNINIQLTGRSFNRQQVEELLEAIDDFVGDGATVNVA